MTLPTFVDGVTTNAANLNAIATGINTVSTALLGAPPPRSYTPHVKLIRAGQSIPHNTLTLMSWTSALSNPDNMWSSGTPTQVTVRSSGMWAIAIQLDWAYQSNAVGGRSVWGMVNGTSVAANAVCTAEQSGAGYVTHTIGNTLHAFTVVYLGANDVVYAGVQQTSGGALATASGAYSASVSSLSMWRSG